MADIELDIVADMEVYKVAEKVVDMVADNEKYWCDVFLKSPRDGCIVCRALEQLQRVIGHWNKIEMFF